MEYEKYMVALPITKEDDDLFSLTRGEIHDLKRIAKRKGHSLRILIANILRTWVRNNE